MCGVVRCFLGNLDVMRMAFQQAGICNLYKLCLFVEPFNGLAAAVAHTGANTAHQLEYRVSHTALIRNTAFYALRN